MAGLLNGGYSPDPLAMGLLGMGGALLTPRAMGGGIGPAMQQFSQQAMLAQEMKRRMASDAQREKLYGAQIQRYEADAAKDAAAVKADADKRAQLDAWVQSLPPEFQQVARIKPEAVVPHLLPQKPSEPYTLPPGAVRYGPDNRPLAENPKQPDPPAMTELEKLMRARDSLPPGDPRRAVFDQAIRKSTTHAPAVSVDARTQFPKQMAGVDADIAKGDMTRWDSTRQARAALRGIMQSSPNAASGPMANVAVKGIDFLASMGIASDQLQKLSTDTAQFNSQATELMLANIKKLGANPSNADREELSKLIPQVTTSRPARERVAQIMLKYTNRAELDAQHRYNYIQQNSGSAGWKPLKVNDMPADKKALMPGAIYQHPVTQEIAVYKGNGQFETVVGDD